jgi:hypothetical protein
MSAHITQAYWRHAVTTAVADGLASGSALTQYIAMASALVDTALVNAGYEVPTSANDTVKLATLGAMLPLIYGGRAGIQVPEGLATQAVGLWKAMATGEVQIPGMTPTARDAVGGVKFTDSSTSSTSSRPVVFAASLHRVF